LILHGRDELLERLAAGGRPLLGQIANAEYALVLPPSFSLWEPRRRPDNLLSLRRSILWFQALQELGSNTVPRIGWVEPTDAERWAAWSNANPEVTAVSLDLMTYGHASFERAIALLAVFDELTGGRLHYLVNGVRAIRRIARLYQAAASTRVTVSDATLVRAPAAGRSNFAARTAEIEERCAHADRLVTAVEDGESVEEFLTKVQAEASGADSVGLVA
jgi:hypothetical protein